MLSSALIFPIYQARPQSSMVQFRGGRPDKHNYRRFKIEGVEGIDDFASIAEVVRRRYSRLLEDKHEMPDLIIIDGGKGQLSSAFQELRKLRLRIPIISIAKREEEIYVPGLKSPLPIKKKTRKPLSLSRKLGMKLTGLQSPITAC